MIPSLVLIHLLLAPYTKVEESFNIQAIHDFLSTSLNIGRPKSSFDHFEFSGAVPRTALGAYLIAIITTLVEGLGKVVRLESLVREDGGEGYVLQIIARGTLGLANAWALWRYQVGLEKAFGKAVGRWFGMLLPCNVDSDCLETKARRERSLLI